MKFLLFLAGIVAFYFGVNYMSLSEGSVERWIKTTQYPSIEASESFCSAITSQTQVTFTNIINNHKKVNTIATDSENLCNYIKSLVIQGVNNKNTHAYVEIDGINRINEIPFNKATVIATVNINSYIDKQRRNKRTGKISKYLQTILISREHEITFKRTMFGDYIILSIKGHDKVTRPEKKHQRL